MPISSASRLGFTSAKNQEPSTSKAGKRRQLQKTSTVKQIRHISPPGALSSTASSLLANSSSLTDMTPAPKSTNAPISIAGQTVRLTSGLQSNKQTQDKRISPPPAPKGLEPSFFSATQFSGHQQRAMLNSSMDLSSLSQIKQLQQTSNASSTCPLNQSSQSPLSIKRKVNLKYVKSIIIALMAIDLLITVFVHQFAQQDQISIWLLGLTTLKVRFSLLNLILSSIWFVLLIGAILFDIYIILLISTLLNMASFVALLGLSVVHFSRRLDYNTIQLTSLLILLFSIVLLHLYLLTMVTLNAYLAMAVKRRKSTC